MAPKRAMAATAAKAASHVAGKAATRRPRTAAAAVATDVPVMVDVEAIRALERDARTGTEHLNNVVALLQHCTVRRSGTPLVRPARG
jgi:hypothetical protein